MATIKPEEALDQLKAENEDAIIFEGFEDCLIGVCYQCGRLSVACYDYDRCIAKLIKRDGMSYEEAVEFFEFNSLGSGLGENTPVFVKLFT